MRVYGKNLRLGCGNLGKSRSEVREGIWGSWKSFWALKNLLKVSLGFLGLVCVTSDLI